MPNLQLEHNGKQIPIADIEIKSSNEQVTLGNLERNLILKTLGKISIQVGNKYFDLNFDMNGNNAVLSDNIFTIKGSENINPNNYPNASFIYDLDNEGFYFIYNKKILELASGKKSKLFLSFAEEQDLNGEEGKRLIYNAKLRISKLEDIKSFTYNDVYKDQVLFIEDQKQHYILENVNLPNIIRSWRPLYLSTNGGVLYNGLTIYNKDKNYTLSLEGLEDNKDNIFNGLRIGTNGNYIKSCATIDNSIINEFNGKRFLLKKDNDTVFEYNNGNIGIGGNASREDYNNVIYGKTKLIGNLFTNYNIMSDDYISRNITQWNGGNGYALKKTSIGTWFLEVDDLVVRNSISAEVLNLKELVVDRTYATGGHMMVTDGSTVTKIEYYPSITQKDKDSLNHPLKETNINGEIEIGESYYFVYFNKQDEKTDEDNKDSKFDAGAFCPFIKDDILLCQSFKGLKTKKYYIIASYSDNYRIAVKYKDFYGSYVIIDSERPSTDFDVENTISVEDELVRIGNQDPKRVSRQKVIDINGMKNWITMYDNLNSLTYAKDEEGEFVLDDEGNKIVIDGPLTYDNLKLRIGDLAGLPDIGKGGVDVLPDDVGYGLYAENVYLKGKLVLWRKEDGVEYSEFLGINRGAWKSTEKYYIGDRVTYNGSYYYCQKVDEETNYNIGKTPSDYTDYWILLVAKGEDGKPGDSVSYVNVTGLSYFKVDTSNISDPSSISLTASLHNIDIDPLLKTIRFQWYCNSTIVKDITYSESFNLHLKDDLNILYKGINSNTVNSSIKETDWTPIWENANYNTFICKVYINGTNVAEDQFTIYKIKDGQDGGQGNPGTDALTFVLSNEAITIPASYTGFISPDFIGLSSKSQCSLTVFRGLKQLNYSTTLSPDNFSFTINPEISSYFQKTNNTFYLIKGHYIDDLSVKLPEGFIVSLDININGTHYNKKVSYSLSKAGQDQNLLDWVKDWTGNSTEISSDGIISPKIYVGNKISKVNNKYVIEDGIYLGRGLNQGEPSSFIGYKSGSRMFELTAEGRFFLGKQKTGATSTSVPTYENGGLTFDGDKLIIGNEVNLGDSKYTLSEYITKTDNYENQITKIVGDDYITQSELFNLKEIKQRIDQEYRDIVTNLTNLLGMTEESLPDQSNNFKLYKNAYNEFVRVLNYYINAIPVDGFIPVDSNYNLTTANTNYYGTLISIKLEIENLVKIKFEINTNNVIRSENIPTRRADSSFLQVGDIWIKTVSNNTIDLFSEIVISVTEQGLATWRFLGDNTGTVIDNGLISTGTIKLMDKVSNIDKAGITGSNAVKLYFNPSDLSNTNLISSTVHTDESFIRFWAGLKEQNKTWNDAPFRVYENGAIFASAGKIGCLSINGDNFNVGGSSSFHTINTGLPEASLLRNNPGLTINERGDLIGQDYFLSGDSTKRASVFIGKFFFAGDQTTSVNEILEKLENDFRNMFTLIFVENSTGAEFEKLPSGSNPSNYTLSIRANHGLFTHEFLSAKGSSPIQGGGGGMDEELLWSILANSGTEQIAKNHLTTALNGYATESWVNSKNYLLASSYTASDILSKLKTVDGSGSGLDADLLDGFHENSFFRSAVDILSYDDVISPTANAGQRAGSYTVNHGGYTSSLLSFQTTGSAKWLQLWETRYGNGGELRYRVSQDNNLSHPWVTLLDTKNWQGIIDGRYLPLTDPRISQWNTAYSWGNHSLVGYALNSKLLEHTNNSIIHVTQTDKNLWNKISNLFDIDKDGHVFVKNNKGFYSNSFLSAKGLSEIEGGGGGMDEELLWSILANSGTEQIAKNHLTTALNGYATESWVNSKNYLLASSYTASDILSKLKTVDGSGSGLDADLLDGFHENSFFRSAVDILSYDDVISPTANAGQRAGSYTVNHGGYTSSLLSFQTTGSAKWLQLWETRYGNGGELRYRVSQDNNLSHPWVTLLDTKNWQGIIDGRYLPLTDPRISQWNTAYSWGNHSLVGYALNSKLLEHTNNSIIHVTQTDKNLWNKISNLFDIDKDGHVFVKNNKGFYSNSFLSAKGLSEIEGGGGTSYDRLDYWSDYSSDKAGYVLSAGLGNDLDVRVKSLESGSALSISTIGGGNVISSISKNGTIITATKGLMAILEGDSRLTDSRNAKDVYTWAKEVTKPTYYYSEVGAEQAFSKNTAFNKNFGTTAGTVAQGNDSRILNGQTAFGWGNHALAGYALSNSVTNSLSLKADKTITFTAGAGLTGGGDLSTNRSFALASSGVGAGTYKSVTVDIYGRVTAGTNPTTLTGFGITDGVNSVTINGSGNAITLATVSGHGLTLTKGITFLEKATFDDLFEKVLVDGVWTIKAKYGLWTDFFLSAKGLSAGSGGGGGMDEELLWSILGNNGTEKISNTHLNIANWALQATKPTYSYSEITGTPPAVDLSNYVTLNGTQTISGVKVFSSASYHRSQSYFGVSDNGILHSSGDITALSFRKIGGTASQFLKADGSVDSNAYVTINHDHSYVKTEDYRTRNPVDFSNKTFTPFFLAGSKIGLSSYFDAMYLNTYLDASGGKTNLIALSKVNGEMYRMTVDQGTAAWNGTLFRILDTSNWQGVVDGRYLPLTGGLMSGYIRMPDNVAIQNSGGSGILFYDGISTQIGTPVSVTNVRNNLTVNGNIKGGHLAWRPEIGSSSITNEVVFGMALAGGSFNAYVRLGMDKLEYFNGSSKTIWHSGNDGTGSGLDADLLDGVHLRDLYIPSTNLSSVTNKTVLDVKNDLVNYFNTNGAYGVGQNAHISQSAVGQWDDDSASLMASSVYNFIKIGGGYPGTTYGQWLLSSYGLSEVGVVGRNNNAWTSIKWFAFKDGNIASATKLQTSRTINGTLFDGTANIETSYWGASRVLTAGTDCSGSVSVNGSGNVTLPITVNVATKLRNNRTNYKSTTDDNVVGQLMWKNYGNGFTIFDASNGTTPTGAACSNRDVQISWVTQHPTLMGYDGVSTYGVRVDYSNRSDRLATARMLWGQSFDGTSSISGELSGVTSIEARAANRLALYGDGDIWLVASHSNTSSVVLNSTQFKPFDTANGTLDLGSSLARWKNLYSINGVFSNNVTAASFTGSLLGNASSATKLVVTDNRGADRAPDYYDARSITTFFNGDIPGTYQGSWHSGITVKGWQEGYAAWQLFGYSSTSNPQNQLCFRTGIGSTWNTTAIIYHTLNCNNTNTDWRAQNLLASGYGSFQRVFTGYDSGVANSMSASNWFRSSGTTGWLNDTYGGGIYMIDSVYVRTFNNKKFFVGNTDLDAIRTDGGVHAASTIRSVSGRLDLGLATLRYDAANKAIYFVNSDGTPLNIYCDGSISAKGLSTDAISNGNYTFGNKLFVDALKSTTINTEPSISLAIGNHNTGLDWQSNNVIDFRANGVQVAYWSQTEFMVTKNLNALSASVFASNVGIGSIGMSLPQKLTVNGNIIASGTITQNTSTSDRRLKTNIADFKAEGIIKSLMPKTYNWNDTAKQRADVFNTDKLQYGLIYQDVKSNEYISEFALDNMFGDGYGMIAYERFIPLLIQGEIEIYNEVDELKKEVVMLKNRIKELEERV